MLRYSDIETRDKQKALWLELPVPLAWLAKLDDCPSAIGIGGAFGDRYLCENNPPYAHLRRAALGYDYRFSAEDSDLWRDYQSFSLVTLQRILSSKIIPYLDTRSAVTRLLECNPAAALAPGYIVNNLRHNHIFHESAHCVAHSAVRELEASTVASSEREGFVVEAILAEAFANTVEHLGSAVQQKAQQRVISDLFFYTLNSYIRPRPERTETLADAEREFGRYVRFALLFFAFAEANLSAAEALDDGGYARISAAVGLPATHSPLAKQTIDMGFGLNIGFRKNTTPAWFALLGYQKEYAAVTRARLLEDPCSVEFVSLLAGKLWELAGHP
jgi:hypothetical protein